MRTTPNPVVKSPGITPVINYHSGKLWIDDGERMVSVAAWPDLTVEGDTQNASGEYVESVLVRQWIRTVPPQGLDNHQVELFPIHSAKSSRKRLAEHRRHQEAAAWLFSSTIPIEIRQQVMAYPDHHYQLLKFYASVEFASQLFQSNAGVLYSLCHCDQFKELTPDAVLSSWRSWIRKKQREIIGWLGFPECQQSVKILAKLTPDACSMPRLLFLRSFMRDENHRQMLSGMPRLTPELIDFIEDASRILTLEAVSRVSLKRYGNPNIAPDCRAHQVIKDCIRMARLLGQTLPDKEFHGLKALKECHDALTEETNLCVSVAGNPYQFQPAPFPGSRTIVPLETPAELVTEGKEMQTCVASYVGLAMEGNHYIYKVTAPRRATLCLCRNKGRWELMELREISNNLAKIETMWEVRDWLLKNKIEYSTNTLRGCCD